MSDNCKKLHDLTYKWRHFGFQDDFACLPDDGVYSLFERGEVAHGCDRIVQVGSHTGEKQLVARLKQHFG